MTGQGLESGPLAIDEVQDQELTEHQLVAQTGPQYPQALRHAAEQRGQGHGPGLLGNM
jgi:hypothetical protein